MNVDNGSEPKENRFSESDFDGTSDAPDRDLPIGRLISELRGLTTEQIQDVVVYQRKHRIRFGEAAVALKLVTSDDVLRALSTQYQYNYRPELSENTVYSELVVAANPFSDEAEGFRELRSQLLMGVFANDRPRQALSIISPNVGDGKSYIAANIAVAFSQLGGRTLLVDADMRTPRQHKVFDIDPQAGLSNILSGRRNQAAIAKVRDLPCLYVMSVGPVPPNPLELIQRSSFGALINELLTKFDYVIVDTPAAVHGADARMIAAKTGAALVVGRKNKSKTAALQSLLKTLGKSSVMIAGVILNEN